MKTRTAPFGFSPIGLWLIRLAGQFPLSNRQARRRSMRRHEGETLESRVVMSASSVASAARSPISAADVLSQLTTSNTASRIVADPNDQISEAVNMGAITTSRTQLGTIDSRTDVDMYRFTVTAGQRISFDVDVTGGLDSVIRLFDSSGRQLAINDDGAAPGESRSLASYLEHTFASRGTYYLGVSGYGNSSYNARTGAGDTNGSTGDFELTVRAISTQPVDPPTSQFDSENNNSISQANFIGTFNPGFHSRTNYGSTGDGADTQDWISFRLAGRTTGTIQISGMFQDLDLELYNSSGNRIASSTNSGTRTDTINLNGLAAGTYYVRVLPGVSGARSGYAMRFGLNVT